MHKFVQQREQVKTQTAVRVAKLMSYIRYVAYVPKLRYAYKNEVMRALRAKTKLCQNGVLARTQRTHNKILAKTTLCKYAN